MRPKVDKSQQSAYLVQVWTQYHSYAPKNRDELVSFVKSINPNFTCSAIVSGDAQSKVKQYYAENISTIPVKPASGVEEIKNDPLFFSLYYFCKDLRSKFEQANKDSQTLATLDFVNKLNKLENKLDEALKLLDEHGIEYDKTYFKS